MLENKTIISINMTNQYYNCVFKTETTDVSVTLSKEELDQYMRSFYVNSMFHDVMIDSEQAIFFTDHAIINCKGPLDYYEDYIHLFQTSMNQASQLSSLNIFKTTMDNHLEEKPLGNVKKLKYPIAK